MGEEDAFNMLKFLMYDVGLRKQYRPDMIILQVKCSDTYTHTCTQKDFFATYIDKIKGCSIIDWVEMWLLMP